MVRSRCPYCYRRHDWPDIFAETTVKCPGCARFYNADPYSPPPAPALAVIPPEPKPDSLAPDSIPKVPSPPRRVTAPHRCFQCRGLIDEAHGRRRLTLPCPSCRLATSIHAVLHRCPSCDAALESPLGTVGSRTPCPGCGDEIEVPAPLLAADHHQSDETHFALACRHCDRRVFVSRDAVGRWAVCPHCERPQRVPPVGEAIRPHERRFGPDILTTHCAHCHLEIPRHVENCPHCDAPDPFER